MNKVNKVTAFMLLVLIATTVASVISLVNATTANTKLRNEVKAYKAYYNASEALFNEIEYYNENLFDSDKAIDYYEAKKSLPISNKYSSVTTTVCEDSTSLFIYLLILLI